MQHNNSDPDYMAMVNKTAHLQAENESLKELLLEYRDIVLLKQKELQEQGAAGIEITNSFQSQSVELQSHKYHINELLQKTAAIAQRENELEKEAAGAVSIARQLDSIKIQYDYLQVQLYSLEERQKQLSSQYILQQQSAGRIAELESLLAIAEDALCELKNKLTED